MKVKNESEVAQSRPTLCDPVDCSLPGSSIHGIFLTQGSNPGLWHCRRFPALQVDSLPTEPLGKPAATAAKLLQSCLTLCDPIDGSPPDSPCPWDSPGKNTGVGRHFLLQCMKVKIQSEIAQSCPTLSDPMDCSLPGSSTHGIFQARVLEWVAVAFS